MRRPGVLRDNFSIPYETAIIFSVKFSRTLRRIFFTQWKIYIQLAIQNSAEHFCAYYQELCVTGQVRKKITGKAASLEDLLKCIPSPCTAQTPSRAPSIPRSIIDFEVQILTGVQWLWNRPARFTSRNTEGCSSKFYKKSKKVTNKAKKKPTICSHPT